MEIIYATCVRRKPNAKYYEMKFKGFKAERIYVSEFPPGSKRNRGYDARYFWSPCTDDQAMRFDGQVFFKNASFRGGSRFYIKDRGGK